MEYENSIKDIVKDKYLFTEAKICEVWLNFVRKAKRKLPYIILMKELLKTFSGFN